MSSTDTNVYTTIRDRILNIEFGVNQRINSIELATQLGVSRTVVREALLRLSAEEIIKKEPQKGFRTHDICPHEIRNLLELRLALESMTVQLAARRGTHEQLQELVDYTQQTLQYAPPDYTVADMIHYDEKFHVDIAIIAGNPELVKQLQRLNQRIRLIRWVQTQKITLPARKQHMYIAEALLERNEKKALRYINKHISNRIQTINEDLSKRLLFNLGDGTGESKRPLQLQN